jgi:hypothetical protein
MARQTRQPVGLFALRLDRLFRTVHPKDRGHYTPAEVADAINAAAGLARHVRHLPVAAADRRARQPDTAAPDRVKPVAGLISGSWLRRPVPIRR